MATSVTIERFPAVADEFRELHSRVARSPEGGAAMMVVALHIYTEDQDMGEACIAQAVAEERRQADGTGLPRPAMQRIKMQLSGRAHIPRSYIGGATPENGYRLPDPPYTLEFSRNPYSGDEASGRVKVFVACSGADSARPVSCVRDQAGVWRAIEWSSLIVGVTAPQAS